MGINMPHLPQVGSQVIEHEINEDFGINRFNLYVMINSVNDKGIDVYILRSNVGDYAAATHSDFESTHLPYSEGFNDEVLAPKMRVVDLNNKTISRLVSDNKDIIIQFNVFEGRYQIALPEKSSDNVFADMVKGLNTFVTADNFRKFLGKDCKYKVKWNKNHYDWLIQ